MRTMRTVVILAAIAVFGAGCSPQPALATPVVSATPNTFGFNESEFSTLNSIEQLDDYPLYTMRYIGSYPTATSFQEIQPLREIAALFDSSACQVNWGCSLFAAFGDDQSRIYGRNFDWQYSPAILLFTDPPDGYSSVAMVDITYLGFDGDRARNLLELSLEERKSLLDAPSLPFDGMNEKGLAVGMAAVPPGEMQLDPQKDTIDELMVIREILDHAATVDEAVAILGSYNIDMGTVPIHYLIASAAGDSALVEFYQGEMFVFPNELPWQPATNFLVASTDGSPQGECWRYDLVNGRLQKTNGQINVGDSLRLLADVSQSGSYPTQWSVVYDMTDGMIHIVMGRDYGTVYSLQLNQIGE